MNTNEAVVNAALDQIGYKRHISSLYDGTPAARAALDIYSQTRNSLLASIAPAWARQDVSMTLVKSAPADGYVSSNWDAATNPPFPWLFEYGLPPDAIVPLQVKPNAFVTLPRWRPRYIPFREAINNLGDNVILTNVPDAILTYIDMVVNPTRWHDEFTAAMIQALAQQLQSLVGAAPKEPERADKT